MIGKLKIEPLAARFAQEESPRRARGTTGHPRPSRRHLGTSARSKNFKRLRTFEPAFVALWPSAGKWHPYPRMPPHKLVIFGRIQHESAMPSSLCPPYLAWGE